MDRRTFLTILGLGVLTAGCSTPTPSPTAVPPAKPTGPPPSATAVAPTAPPPKPTAAATAKSAPVATAAPAVKTLVKVALAFPTQNISISPFYVGKEKGFFREEGIDLDLQQVPSANAIKAMLAGQLDFTTAAGTALLGILDGAPLKIILLTTRGPIAWLYTRQQHKSLADLRGGSIAISAPGDYSHELAAAAVSSAKLNPETDVKFVAIPGASRTRLQAVLSGSVDATIVNPPENLIADQQGLNQLLFLMDVWKQITSGAATTDAAIRDKPEVVRGFVRGAVKSVMFQKGNRAGTIPLQAAFQEITTEQAAVLYDGVSGAFTDQGDLSDETLQTMLDEQKRVSKITEAIPLNKVFDMSFVRRAAQEIVASGWKP